jgi:hypothetical protein
VRVTGGLSREDERQLAVDLFNHVWVLLDRPDRTPEDDDLMVHAAHASAFHWSKVGTPVNGVRGEWQCSRVYAVLGRAEPALHHARRCLELSEAAPDLEEFDLPFAYEAMARALAVAGDRDAARDYLARGREAAAGIADAEDRAIVERDLDSAVPS